MTVRDVTHVKGSESPQALLPLCVCHTIGQPTADCRSILLPLPPSTAVEITSKLPQTSDKNLPGAATSCDLKLEKNGKGNEERCGTAKSTCCASDIVVSERTESPSTLTVIWLPLGLTVPSDWNGA